MRAADVILHQRLGLFIADHNSNVLPRGGAPVGIVIALLGDFQAPPCSSSVLSCVNRQITFELLVSGKQTCDISKTTALGGYFLGSILPPFSSKRYDNDIKQISSYKRTRRDHFLDHLGGPSVGAYNSHTKPMSRHFCRPV